MENNVPSNAEIKTKQQELAAVQQQIVDLKKKETELQKATIEKFSWSKFFGGLNFFDPVGWAKWIIGTARTIVVLGLVASLIFGVGYWRGRESRPVNVGYKDFQAQVVEKDGTKHSIAVKGGILYFDGKTVKTGDIAKLKDFGIVIRPKVFFGMGTALEPEIGAGFQLLKYKKFNLDAFGTQKALYVGISYDLDFSGTAGTLIQNSSVGVAVGKTWESMFGKADNGDEYRALVYWSVRF